MSLTIVATAGAADANSYVTRDEADTYMASRLNASAWDDADDPNVALAEATREIDLCTFVGYRTDDTQVLQWPRQWATDPDSPTDTYYETDEIPQRVKDACCELALEFLKAGTTDIAVPNASNAWVKRKKVDVLETEYALPEGTAPLRGLARYPRVLQGLWPLLASSAGQSRIVRG